MERVVLKTTMRARWVIAAIFAAELTAGIAVFVYLYINYAGVMNASFLITMPLLGVVIAFTMRMPPSPGKGKLFHAFLAFLFSLPIALLFSYTPRLTYEEAKHALQSAHANAIFAETEKRTFSMEDTGNPFITHAYYFLLHISGDEVEYIVNPATGKIAELPSIEN